MQDKEQESLKADLLRIVQFLRAGLSNLRKSIHFVVNDLRLQGPSGRMTIILHHNPLAPHLWRCYT